MLTANLANLAIESARHGESAQRESLPVSTMDEPRYFVIPLSVQQEGDLYIVGNTDLGDFYQFPPQGVRILHMLVHGETATTIKSRLATEDAATVDVDGFLAQLTDIGFIHPENQRHAAQDRLRTAASDTRRTFDIDARLARAIFSAPVLACCSAVVLYASLQAIQNPDVRLNVDAFYTPANKTPLLIILVILSLMHTALHELGHMLAAARQGTRSKYGIGNRLWNIVAESDLTGILALPKSQRYLPLLAGLLVDILVIALLTILLSALLRHGAGAFTVQIVQAFVLEIVIGIAWQFNVFVKTDIYFVICNYLSYPDLDRDARTYLYDLLYRVSSGRFGRKAASGLFRNPIALRAFSAIWMVGRILSLLILFCVFLPTIWQYIGSSIQLLRGPPASLWMAVDTILYVSITVTTLGAGMYIWLKNR
jgi:hypothetical protein